jgi:MFS-type transporter involved in bile tolerance (Atg22 family)
VVSWGLLYLGIAASIIGVLGVLGPGFAENVLGLEPEDFVVIVLPLGVGVVIGALAVNAIQGIIPRRRVIEAGLLVLGVCLVLLTASSSIVQVLGDVNEAVPGPDLSSFVSVLTVVIAIAVVAGVSYAAIAIPAQTELQAEIPEEVRGRVFGILNMLVSVGSFLPIIIVGPIADLVGTMPVVLVSAVIILAVGILSVARRRDHAPAGTATTQVTGAVAEPAIDEPAPEEP